MKRFLIYILLFLSFKSFSFDHLKRIDSILVSNGYKTNIDNLENDNYYHAWKQINKSHISIDVFGEGQIDQIRVSQTICPSLDSLSVQEEINLTESAKTKIIEELELILPEQLIKNELEKFKKEKPWVNSKFIKRMFQVKNQKIELKYQIHKDNKCDTYFDGFYVAISIRFL